MRVEDPVKDARGGFVNPEVPCQERPTALEAEPTDKVALTVVSGLETPVGESLEAEVSPGPSALDMLSLILVKRTTRFLPNRFSPPRRSRRMPGRLLIREIPQP